MSIPIETHHLRTEHFDIDLQIIPVEYGYTIETKFYLDVDFNKNKMGFERSRTNNEFILGSREYHNHLREALIKSVNKKSKKIDYTKPLEAIPLKKTTVIPKKNIIVSVNAYEYDHEYNTDVINSILNEPFNNQAISLPSPSNRTKPIIKRPRVTVSFEPEFI